MPKLALTPAFLRTVRPPAMGQAEYADAACPGLRLRLSHGGTATWVLGCRDVTGKPRRFVLGAYPELGLAAAREEAKGLREKVRRQGKDPIAEARAKRAEARVKAHTLSTLLELYARQKGDRLRSWPEYCRRIESVFAEALARPLAELTLRGLQLQADSWPAQQSAAAAVRYLRPVVKWAAAPGRAYVPRELTEITPPATVARRQRVLDHAELAVLLTALALRTDGYARAFRFILLTLARREEVAAARWRDIDTQAATWLITETKNNKPHLVPLATQALALLRAIRPANAAPEALVFTTSTGGRLGNWDRETKRLMRASGTSGWTRHDLRRTGATLLGSMAIEPHIIEAALNHTHIGGQLAALYNQARYRPQVAQALQRLADELDRIEAGADNVVHLHA